MPVRCVPKAMITINPITESQVTGSYAIVLIVKVNIKLRTNKVTTNPIKKKMEQIILSCNLLIDLCPTCVTTLDNKTGASCKIQGEMKDIKPAKKATIIGV